MVFEDFDLMIRDRYNNSLCVGDYIKNILFIDGKITELKGQIVYSPRDYAFAIAWEDGYTYPLLEYKENFWKGVEKCAKS